MEDPKPSDISTLDDAPGLNVVEPEGVSQSIWGSRQQQASPPSILQLELHLVGVGTVGHTSYLTEWMELAPARYFLLQQSYSCRIGLVSAQ